MKKFFRKSLSLLLALCMLFANVSVFAQETIPYGYVDSQSAIAGTKSGTMHYGSFFNCDEYSYSYDDNWFIEKDAYTFNAELAKQSLKMACAGFAVTDPVNLKAIWDALGYTYTDDSIHYVEPSANFDYMDDSKDTIGFAIAYKNVKSGDEVYTLISLVVRGGGYGLEWGSNFTIGSSGDHKGFSDAAKVVYATLNDYIDKINSSHEIKIWVTGYSRAGSVSNILGHMLNASGSQKYRPEDTYVYAFEPATTTTSPATSTYVYDVIQSVTLDDNIYNIVNVNDIVTLVPMSNLGFSRYGRDMNVGSQLTVPDYYNSDIFKSMNSKYREIIDFNGATAETFKTTFEWNRFSLSKSLFYKGCDFFDNSRQKFIDTNVEELMRFLWQKLDYEKEELDKAVITTSYKPLIGSTKTVTETIEIDDLMNNEITTSVISTLVSQVLTLKKGDNYTVKLYTKPSGQYATCYITKDILMEAAGYAVALLDLADDYGKYVELLGIDVPDIDPIDYETYGKNVTDAHITNYTLAWVECGEEAFSYTRYNKLSVNTNTNVQVMYKGTVISYNSGSTLAAESNTAARAIECYVNDGDGRIYYLVPNSSDYTYTATAASKGTVDIKISEVDVNTWKEVETVAYSISASSGSTYTGNFTDGKPLKDSAGADVSPKSSVNNKPATKAEVSFNQTGYTGMGTVSGNGTKAIGEYVTISAEASSDAYAFVGFYYGDKLVSSNSSYTFRVDQDLELTAKFKSVSSLSVTTNPTKTNYLEAKDSLDLTGGKLKVTYNDGSSKTIDLSAKGVSVTGFDNTKTGEQTLSVSFGGKKTTFKVTIDAKSLVSIEVSKNPTKMEYLEGKDELELWGGELKLNYNNDTYETISLVSGTASGFDNTIVGTNTVTIEWGGKETTLDVTIKAKSLASISIKDEPAKLRYKTGEEIDLAGGKITLNYDNDTTEDIDITAEMISGFDSSVEADEVVVTVTYEGKETSFSVEIKDYVLGDFNGDEEVTSDDAVYLLFCSLDTPGYTLSQDGDVNKDGEVTSDDAVYLLFYTLDTPGYTLD